MRALWPEEAICWETAPVETEDDQNLIEAADEKTANPAGHSDCPVDEVGNAVGYALDDRTGDCQRDDGDDEDRDQRFEDHLETVRQMVLEPVAELLRHPGGDDHRKDGVGVVQKLEVQTSD